MDEKELATKLSIDLLEQTLNKISSLKVSDRVQFTVMASLTTFMLSRVFVELPEEEWGGFVVHAAGFAKDAAIDVNKKLENDGK